MDKLNVYSKPEGSVSVTLHKSPFTSDERYYGRITRRTISLNEIIAMISDKNTGISSLMVAHIASLLQVQILELLKLGYAVNLLDLGTLYMAVKGLTDSENIGQKPLILPKFTVSETLKKTADNITVESVVVSNPEPYPEIVLDTSKPDKTFTVSAGNVCRITGKNLKIKGDDAGLYFASINADGEISKDESTWISVDITKLVTNTLSKIEFYLPSSLSTGKFSIVVRTKYLTSSKLRKTSVTGFSAPVTVE